MFKLLLPLGLLLGVGATAYQLSPSPRPPSTPPRTAAAGSSFAVTLAPTPFFAASRQVVPAQAGNWQVWVRLNPRKDVVPVELRPAPEIWWQSVNDQYQVLTTAEAVAQEATLVQQGWYLQDDKTYQTYAEAASARKRGWGRVQPRPPGGGFGSR